MKSTTEIADVLFPRVRAELLRLLFAGAKKQYYVRELMTLSGLALRTVQEELAKLTRVDLIRSWSNGYHRFYRSNREHPLYLEILHIVQASRSQPKKTRSARLARPAPNRRRRAR